MKAYNDLSDDEIEEAVWESLRKKPVLTSPRGIKTERLPSKRHRIKQKTPKMKDSRDES